MPYGPAAAPSQGATPVSMYLMGTLIVSAVAGLLLLFTDFSEAYWNDYYTEGWVWINAWNSIPGAALVLPLAIVFLALAGLSAQGLRNPALLNPQWLKRNSNLALAATVWMFIDAVIFIAIAVSEDWDWWFEAGFYGGAIGGMLAVVFTRMALTQARAGGVPATAAPPPYPAQPYTSMTPPGQMPAFQAQVPQAPSSQAPPPQAPPKWPPSP